MFHPSSKKVVISFPRCQREEPAGARSQKSATSGKMDALLKKNAAKTEGASKTIKIGWFFGTCNGYIVGIFFSKVCGCVLLVLGMGDLPPLIGNPYFMGI